MGRFKGLFIAVPIAVGLLTAPAAHADWNGRGGGGWHGGGGYGHYHGRGPGVAGAILGLGAAAILGGVIVSHAYPPPVYYGPPRGYYAPPPPVYYAPPPAYYPAPPGYYPPAY